METKRVEIVVYSDEFYNKKLTLKEKLIQQEVESNRLLDISTENKKSIRKAIAPLFFSKLKEVASMIDESIFKNTITIEFLNGVAVCNICSIYWGCNKESKYIMELPLLCNNIYNEYLEKDVVFYDFDNLSVTDINIFRIAYLEPKCIDNSLIKMMDEYKKGYKKYKINFIK